MKFKPNQTNSVAHFLDITGDVCPLTFVRAKLALDRVPEGEILELRLNPGEPLRNIPRSLVDHGCRVLSVVAECLDDPKSAYRLRVMLATSSDAGNGPRKNQGIGPIGVIGFAATNSGEADALIQAESGMVVDCNLQKNPQDTVGNPGGEQTIKQERAGNTLPAVGLQDGQC